MKCNSECPFMEMLRWEECCKLNGKLGGECSVSERRVAKMKELLEA